MESANYNQILAMLKSKAISNIMQTKRQAVDKLQCHWSMIEANQIRCFHDRS